MPLPSVLALIVLITGVLAVLVGTRVGILVDRHDLRVFDRECTIWRAEVENAMYHAGDERGTYGTWDGWNP